MQHCKLDELRWRSAAETGITPHEQASSYRSGTSSSFSESKPLSSSSVEHLEHIPSSVPCHPLTHSSNTNLPLSNPTTSPSQLWRSLVSRSRNISWHIQSSTVCMCHRVISSLCVLRWDMMSHLSAREDEGHWNKGINWWSDKKYFMFLHSELSWINIICVYLLWYYDDFCLILGVYDVRISYRHRTVQFYSFIFRCSSVKTNCFFFWLME